jgi:NAD(P)-dependent dehydrogenase (short-subunit alcohol dehydrogenase family)
MANMQGKVCLITGATNGIGKATAQALANMGATVVVVGRSPEKTRAVVEEIKKASGNEAVKMALADLSSQEDVRELADTFQQKYDRLDVLVNNAGAVFMQRQQTVDGIEMTWGLNHLSYFLLTNLLLDLLKGSAPARIVNVSSDAHQAGHIDFDDIENKKSYSGFSVYGQSKLANILFTYELARRLGNSGVTVNAMHPGFVGTGFARNNGFFANLAMTLLSPVTRSPEKGAETVIYLASSPEVEGVTGKYFYDKRPKATTTESYDVEVARRLWEVSLEQTGLAVTV